MIRKLINLLVPDMALRAATQASPVPIDGLSHSTTQKDNVAFRVAHGGTSGDASDLQVVKYLGGWLWILTSTPNGNVTGFTHGIDHAYNTSNGVMYRYNSGTSWKMPWLS